MSEVRGRTMRERAEFAHRTFKNRVAQRDATRLQQHETATAIGNVPSPPQVAPQVSQSDTRRLTSVIEGSKHAPTATVHQARLRIYQATRRPKMLDQLITTAWGRVRVIGAIGQAHEDVQEAITYVGREPSSSDDGRLSLLVDPAEVRRIARQPSGTTFRRVLDGLMQTVIEIVEPVHLACLGHLIDHIDYRPKRLDGSDIVVPNRLGGERFLWRIEFGKALCRMIDADMWLHWDPSAIASLRHGISQAIVRHVRSHKTVPNGGWTLDGLIIAVAGELSDQGMRDRRRELCGPKGDLEALRHLGVLIESGRVLRVEQKPG